MYFGLVLSVGEAEHMELEKLLCTSEACFTELPVRVRPIPT